jgi:hypothetical protein
LFINRAVEGGFRLDVLDFQAVFPGRNEDVLLKLPAFPVVEFPELLPESRDLDSDRRVDLGIKVILPAEDVDCDRKLADLAVPVIPEILQQRPQGGAFMEGLTLEYGADGSVVARTVVELGCGLVLVLVRERRRHGVLDFTIGGELL